MTRRTLDNRGPRAARRRGVTLTEILISILIMGVGMLSLATLFPLGLLRLRAANRSTRSAYLAQSASADLTARNLLSHYSFEGVPWYYDNTPTFLNPWTEDPMPAAGLTIRRGGTLAPGPGLPVAYDPLWIAITGSYDRTAQAARFGSGVGLLRDATSANGLQRITNLSASANGSLVSPTPYPAPPAIRQMFDYNVAVETFVSPEDLVFQDAKTTTYTDPNNSGSFLASPSPLVPDLSLGGGTVTLPNRVVIGHPSADWRYSWMFTGQQTDAGNSTVFDGYVVVFENRQFSLDPVTPNVSAPAGETTVEAVFGAGSAGGIMGYARSARRAVLLRWSASLPDPEIKVGQWFADVTYDQLNMSNNNSNPRYQAGITRYPAQRCYWYQVAKRTEPGPSPTVAGYREVTVWTTADLRAQTYLNADDTAANVEAALICPSVINVIPRTVVTR